MRTHTLFVVLAAAALAACKPFVNTSLFLYTIDTWSPDGEQVAHRRFVDDVDFPGVPAGEWRDVGVADEVAGGDLGGGALVFPFEQAEGGPGLHFRTCPKG